MIYLDLETTGFKGEEHDVIEIYLLKEDNNGQIIDELHYYIKTNLKIEPHITKINRIDNDFLEDKNYFEQVASEILSFIGNETLVGHNIDGFDLPFLNANLLRKGFAPIQNETIDTMLLARKIENARKYDKGYKLVDLCSKYNIDCDLNKTHTAKYDTLITRKLYKILEKLI